jgi:hypothetical protein
MSRKSGDRFSEKDMRQRKNYSHFQGRSHVTAILLDGKWL